MTATPDPSLSLAADGQGMNWTERLSLMALVTGGSVFLLSLSGMMQAEASAWFMFGTLLLVAGGIGWVLPGLKRPADASFAGTMTHPATRGKGRVAYASAVALTLFYVLVYWFPWTLEGLVRLFDPLSQTLRGAPANPWFMYGFFYTLAILVMGVRALIRYRATRYHVIRTLVLMGVQLVFAFLLPAFFVALQAPELYLSYFWPLDYDLFFPDTLRDLQGSRLGLFMIFWGTLLFFIATPILTYYFGKRWYCSWVCGCGGLAETAGDPYRHLSDKSFKAWKVERWMIHGVLAFIVLTTGLLWLDVALGGVLGPISGTFRMAYGFVIGALFAGVVGVGFYPLMGSRVWCRFGCPMAAILGIQQRFFSRFRITTNASTCISCGNCSTYCEMGIDVKAYAQRGLPIVRASCVGCGMCATVCPRGVLRLENGPVEGRFASKPMFLEDDLGLLPD